MWLQSHDILIHNTKAAEGRYEVSSPIEVTLSLSSDAKDTDFTVKLMNVYETRRDNSDQSVMRSVRNAVESG